MASRGKKIGSITIVKNPNFPSGTSLQAYIKTNRAELRKVFGNPNMGESGDGKSKGKEWNLVVGGKRVTIYDKREKDKKGTKYFNIGGDGKYSALLVAQALSIHRNERVHAKEIVPQWIEDRRQYQQVKSIDEHPDLTYERAKEYEDNRGRYRAETFDAENKRLALENAIEDWVENNQPKTKSASRVKARIFTYSEEADSENRFKTRNEIFGRNARRYRFPKEGLVIAVSPIKKTKALMLHLGELGLIPRKVHYANWKGYLVIPQKFYGAETFNVEFNEWAEQEMMSHGKDISFKDWAEDEGMKHGDVPITEWAQHEDESHDARYGAESFEDFKRKMVGDDAVAGDLGYMEALEEFYEEYLEDFERITDEFCPEPETFEEFQERVLKNDYENFGAEDYQKKMYQDFLDNWDDEWEGSPPTFEEWKELVKDAEDWGGNPKGQLALALQKAREKAKKPKKPLKIEKLDAEGENRYWIKKVKFNMKGENDDYKRKMIQRFGKDGIFTSTKAAKKDFDEMVKQAVNLTNTAYVNGKEIPYPYDEKTVATARAKWNDNPPSRYGKKMNSVTAQGVICWVEYYPMVKLGAETFNADSGWNMPPGVFSNPADDITMEKDAVWEQFYEQLAPEDDFVAKLWELEGKPEPAPALDLNSFRPSAETWWGSVSNYPYPTYYEGEAKELFERHYEVIRDEANKMWEEYDVFNPYDAETSGQWEIGEQLEEAQMNAEGSGRIDHEGGRMVAIDEVITVDYTWRTDPDDAEVDDYTVNEEVEGKIEREMHEGDSGYGYTYAYDDEMNTVDVSYNWDKTKEDSSEEIIKFWADEGSEKMEKKAKMVIENAMKEYDEYVADKEAYDDDDIISFEEWFDWHLGDDELDGDEETLEYLKTLPSYNSPESNSWIWKMYHGDKYKFAEGKKRSGVLSDPFDELSLDSGGWKSIAIGFGVATLTLFGLTKLRK